jgi:uncharacterized protein YacL
MMPRVILFLCFVVLLGASAAILHPFGLPLIAATVCGLLIATVAGLLGSRVAHASLEALVGAFTGAFAGAVLGLLFAFALNEAGSLRGPTLDFFRLAIPLFGIYLGLVAGIGKSGRLRLNLVGLPSAPASASSLKLLDTSVLIDGRIADIAEAGFLEGPLIVPQFVLHELQLVADSADSAKRNRGRRGLDVVQRLQKMPGIGLEVSARDLPAIREVDLKLIELAKQQGSKIVTNDFNLNKLAQVQGVEVLNINELANSLKPVVLPGEVMRVFILKEGKEHNQGVAYLDDGTMVVVDNARRLISKTVDITVTSVLQTTAGKMIFGRYDERLQPTGSEHRAASATST